MSLVINNLCKSFDEKEILNNFSYSFSDRGIYAITGESGVGKTTLLRIISGLDNNYIGEISGVKNVSFAFQEHRLFPNLTALQNVVFAIFKTNFEAEMFKATSILNKLGLTNEEMNLYPSELSGGMKQRVSLARAFLNDADILLLDEPTKELDEENAEIVRTIILEESRKRLVILVSHNKKDITTLNATEIQL